MDGQDIKRVLRFFAQNKLLLGAGATLFALLVVGASLWYAISGVGRRQDVPGVPSVPASGGAATTTMSATSSDMLPRRLDGVLVASGTEALPAFAIAIDGHVDARPTAGLAEANLVFNVPVEGGITRYLAVYDASSTAEMIGPVRSARQYCVELADGLDAVFGHVGGSPEALEGIKAIARMRDLNEYSNARSYWRSGKREAPHNVFTRMDLLNAAFMAKGWKIPDMGGWNYKDDDPLEGGEGVDTRGETQGPSLAYDRGYDVRWTYDWQANAYHRHLSGAPQADADGAPILAKNVVVVLMPAKVVDAVGRLSMSTIGRGKAVVYRDGHVSEAVWRRRAGERLAFETVDGSDVLLDRGTTWVEVVGDAKVFDVAKALKP